MASDIDICNRALLKTGSLKRLADLSDTSTEGLACATLYPQLRDELLVSGRWRFATRHQVLAQLVSTRPGWTYAYQLPDDCLSPWYIFTGVRPGGLVAASPGTYTLPRSALLYPLEAATSKIPYEVQLNDTGDGQVLLCDQPTVDLVYTVKAGVAGGLAPGLFPPLFSEGLAWKLASELALAVAKKADLSRYCLQQALSTLAQARARELNEQQEDAPADADYITARG